MQIIVRFLVPSAALILPACEDIRPDPLRKIEPRFTAVVENRRAQEAVPQHILRVYERARRILREFQQNRTHHRHAGAGGVHRLGVQIGHQAQLETREFPRDLHGLLPIQPRHLVFLAAVIAAVRRQ